MVTPASVLPYPLLISILRNLLSSLLLLQEVISPFEFVLIGVVGEGEAFFFLEVPVLLHLLEEDGIVLLIVVSTRSEKC